MAYKTRTPLARVGEPKTGIRPVLTLESQANITTQNLGRLKKNVVGHQ